MRKILELALHTRGDAHHGLGQRELVHERCTVNAGEGLCAIEHTPIVRENTLRVGGKARGGNGNARCDHVRGLEAGLDRTQRCEAAHEKHRRGDEHDRQRDLTHHERAGNANAIRPR